MSTLKEKLTQLGAFLARHKYMATFLVFVFYLLFFDKNNLRRRWEVEQEIITLDREKERLLEEREKNFALLDAIEQDEGALEKVAREKYMMKKDNEDIYVFEGEDEEDASQSWWDVIVGWFH